VDYLSLMAGYSGTPLATKLGLKPGIEAVVLKPPRPYAGIVSPLPDGVRLRQRLHPGAEFIHFFTRSRADLARRFPRLAGALADPGVLWISWPKRSSPLAGDLDENIVRELGLAAGLVDVKVCAVDDDWSALKFVRRVADRGSRG
jgi:hypothetical protein